VSKLLILPLVSAFTFAIVSGAFGQGTVNYTTNPTNNAGDAANGGLNLQGAGASATSKQNTGTEDENDPTLERLRSKESLGAGSMSRDDGQLTAKARRREKVSQVDSTKHLPTSGTDPKFQGSLLHSSVSSIADLGEKAVEPSPTPEADHEANDESDSRFKAKRLVFTPMSDDEPKKKESPRSKEDASPSPSPKASASPASH